jgi:hypothetical protein
MAQTSSTPTPKIMNEQKKSKFDPRFTIMAIVIIGLILTLLFTTRKPRSNINPDPGHVSPETRAVLDRMSEENGTKDKKPGSK